MAQRILNLKQIEYSTGRVICGGEQATLFLVSPNRCITARHVLFDSDNNLRPGAIQIELPSLEPDSIIQGKLLKDYPQLDIAFIDLPEDFYSEHFLPLNCSQVAIDSDWEIFGYPSERILSGVRVKGKVSYTTQTYDSWDLYLNPEREGQLARYVGMSGSAVIVDGYVIGIAIEHEENSMFAVSTMKLKSAFDEIEVEYHVQRDSDLPYGLEETIQSRIENNTTKNHLDDRLRQIRNGYLSLLGQPGSGKTTFIASYELPSEEFANFGKYFVRVPGEDSYSRIQRDTFLQWVERLGHNLLSGAPPPKRTIDKTIESFPELLTQVGAYFSRLGKVGVLFIDGLDDIYSDGDITHFLSILPEILPTGLVCVFSCTATSILPTKFRTFLQESRTVHVSRLDYEKCVAFISDKIESEMLSPEQIHVLADRAEGHPLYLRYLLREVISGSINDIESWLKSLPIIGGDIQQYYEKIWVSLETQRERYWLIAVLSNFRQEVAKDILYEILPSENKPGFNSALMAVQHLLTERFNKISVYHSSFSSFVRRVTQLHKKSIHDGIYEYCVTHPAQEFSVSNIIFHILQSHAPEKVLEYCSQDWADQCAIFHVSPDLVLADIEQVVQFCSLSGDIVNLIEKLLLLQRVRFRYDFLLKENAFELANALISNGSPENAIKYLIRDSGLIVNDIDAPHFVQRFFERDAVQEGTALLQVIRKRFQSRLSAEMKQGFISPETFLIIMSPLVFYAHANWEAANNEFVGRLKSLGRFLMHAKSEEDGRNAVFLEALIDQFVVFQAGYQLYAFGHYGSIEERKKLGYEFNQNHTKILADISRQYQNFENQEGLVDDSTPYPKLIADIESLVDEFGYIDRAAISIARALIKDSSRSDLVAEAARRYISNNPLNYYTFRKENGVDLNESLEEFFEFNILKGYLQLQKHSELLLPKMFSTTWEAWLLTFMKILGQTFGMSYRAKADNQHDLLSRLSEKTFSFLKELTFTLDERRNWERSYLLPEQIFSFVYRYLTELIIAFSESSLQIYIDFIEERSKDQLGLYTEGYRESLLSIIKTLIKYEQHKKLTFKVVRLLEDHVVNGVLNRWERVPLLIQIYEFYGKLNNRRKAQFVFREILASSMGPSWYKESQFGLINSAVASLGLSEGTEKDLSTLAAILELASGELAFQEYTTHNMESLISDIASEGYVKYSIELFRYWLLPSLKTVIANAEAPSIDMPVLGDGYNLGARLIDEQNVITSLLHQVNDMHPLVKWAFAEIFLYGDLDNASSLVEVQCKIINEFLVKGNSQMVDELIQRLIPQTEYVLEQDYNQQGIQNYFESIFKVLNSSLHHRIEHQPMAVNDFDVMDFKINELSSESSQFVGNEIALAIEEIEMENWDAAQSHLLAYIHSHHEKKIPIWYPHYSDELTHAFTLLTQVTANCSEVVQLLLPYIQEPLIEEWVVVNKLIGLLKGMLSAGQKSLIMKAILQHLAYMVSLNPVSVEKYLKVFDTSHNSQNADALFTEFLVWLLNIPSASLRQRTCKVLTWLTSHCHSVLIPYLFKEIVSGSEWASKQYASEIIKEYANIAPEIIWMYLNDAELIQELVKINHFVIQFNLLQSVGYVSKSIQDEKITFLMREIVSKYSPSVECGQLEEETKPFPVALRAISPQIIRLMKTLDLRDDFFETIENYLQEECQKKDLNINNLKQASKYIKRSFYVFEDVSEISRDAFIYALSHSLLGRIPQDKFDLVYNIITK